MTASDANDLDDIVRLLAIEDDCCTPAEAVEMMIEELKVRRAETERLRASIGAAVGEFERGLPLSAYGFLLNAQEGLP